MNNKNEFIFETAVYCGNMKEWRILNFTSGTVYSMAYLTEQEALDNIEHNTNHRGGKIVKRITLKEINMLLADNNY
jgi:hypothetical protein